MQQIAATYMVAVVVVALGQIAVVAAIAFVVVAASFVVAVVVKFVLQHWSWPFC
jgi:hypothetical protein